MADPDACNGLDDDGDGQVDEGSCSLRYRCASPARCTCARGYRRCGDECLIEWAQPAECGGACALLLTDYLHCGACGRRCWGDQLCVEGVCVCGSGSRCGDSCVDPESDPMNCGSCGNRCGEGHLCERGRCVCAYPYMMCDGRCVRLAPDSGCAPVELICPPGTHRDSDRCVCDVACGGRCIFIASDPLNCGRCGDACAEGVPCIDSRCTCAAPRITCGRRCLDPREDRANCGACDRACEATETCHEGACRQRLGVPAAAERTGARRPTLQWPGGTGAADVCADRACARVLESVAGSPAASRLTRPLEPGVYFWRVRLPGAPLAAAPSSSFRVDRRDAPRAGLLPPAPDLNDDGLADVVAATSSEVVVFLGARSALPTAADRRLVRAAPTAVTALRLAGDVDVDGFGDVALSGDRAPVELLTGGASAEAIRFDVGFRAPTDLSPVFDVNGDAAPDGVAVVPDGARIFYRDPRGAADADLLLEPASARPFSAAPVGDVNGDGYRDVAVGALGGMPPRVRVHFGSAAGLDRALPLAAPAGATTFGTRVRCAGDVNGDGFADVLVGLGPSGAALYLGGASAVTLHRTQRSPSGGVLVVGAAGDVDGDGFGDLIAVPAGAGELWLFRGGASGLAETHATLRDPRWADVTAIGVPRDVDGDGFDDLVLGAPTRGAVYVLHGAATRALERVETLLIASPPVPGLLVL